MALFSRIEQLVGNTPMLRLSRLEKELHLSAEIYAKLEYFNPAGSSKDRAVKSMLDDLERRGKLVQNAVIIEPTSGNTGVALAVFGKARGYNVVIVMPENCSFEKMRLIRSYGACIVLIDQNRGMQGAIDKANELLKRSKNAVMLSQFENPANPSAHEQTGAEIYRDLGGVVDELIVGVGTGGTLTGVARQLKSRIQGMRVVAVEPSRSAVLSGGKKGEHNLEGIGAGFIPKTLDVSLIDEVAQADEKGAERAKDLLARTDGIMVGRSSGAVLSVAIAHARREENTGKKLVVVFPDSRAGATCCDFLSP